MLQKENANRCYVLGTVLQCTGSATSRQLAAICNYRSARGKSAAAFYAVFGAIEELWEHGAWEEAVNADNLDLKDFRKRCFCNHLHLPSIFII